MEPITLSEMKDIRLMNRIDTKYLVSAKLLPELLRQLENDFRIQEVEGKKISGYRTMYFDTEDMSMYLMHHNAKRNRQKIRSRCYVDSGITFLEIKKKDNKGRTRKERIRIPNEDFSDFSSNPEAVAFVEKNTGFKIGDIFPTVLSSFDRITLVNYERTERITIDTNLYYSNFRTKKNTEANDLVIIELKQDGKTHSLLKDKLAEYRVFPGGMSKYCLGCVLTDENAKQNRFKQKVRYINKLTT
jgi:hypothetical protein